jgi:hypothetical protein
MIKLKTNKTLTKEPRKKKAIKNIGIEIEKPKEKMTDVHFFSKKERKEEREKNNRRRQTAYHPLPFVAS